MLHCSVLPELNQDRPFLESLVIKVMSTFDIEKYILLFISLYGMN